MALPKEKLQDGINAIERLLDLEASSENTNILNEVFDTAFSFKYKPDNSTSGGFKSVTSSDRDIISSVDGSVPNQIKKKVGVVQLDSSAKKDELIKKVGSDATDLSTITGDSRLSEDGFLDVAISAPFPEALAEVVKSTTTASSNEITNIVGDNVATELARDNILDNVLGDVLNTTKGLSSLASNTFLSQVSSLNKLVNNSFSGFSGLVENLVEKTFQSTENLLGSVAKKGDVLLAIPSDDIKVIVELRQKGDIDKAVSILKKYSDKSDAELREVILKIDNRASKALEPTAVSVDIPTKRTDNYINVWRESTTDISTKIFDSVEDISEVETEVANLKRDVTQMVWEAWSVSASDGKGTVEGYHQVFVNDYNQGLEPHFFIDQAGILYRGRPLEIKGTGIYYGELPDHSERTILIALEELEWKVNSTQIKTVKKVMEAIYNVKPGIQTLALYDILSTTESPWWDVQNAAKIWFGKENIQDYNPRKSPPLTQKQIIDGLGN